MTPFLFSASKEVNFTNDAIEHESVPEYTLTSFVSQYRARGLIHSPQLLWKTKRGQANISQLSTGGTFVVICCFRKIGDQSSLARSRHRKTNIPSVSAFENLTELIASKTLKNAFYIFNPKMDKGRYEDQCYTCKYKGTR